MKRILILAAVTAACSPQAPWSVAPDSAATRAAATITAGDMYDRIAFLASDDLRGRDTPSPGLETAARWVADELASFGLHPAGDDGWFQRYPYPEVALDVGRTTFAAVAGATHSFEYGRDFLAWPGAEATVTAAAVFAGSATAGPGGPAGAELEPADDSALLGRALLTPLPGLPEAGATGLRLDRGARRHVAAMRARALDAGAAAVVFLLDERVTTGEVAALAEEAERARRRFGDPAPGDALPTFFVHSDAAGRMLRMAGRDPAPFLGGGQDSQPVSLPGLSLRMAAPTRVLDDARPPNVVGVLRGRDLELRNSYVVVSAHMDHVGVGRPDETGDSIYNGADDDASGVAVLVEVAQALAALETRPRRSVLFVAVSGEEKGLLGSRWFSDNPTVPLEAMVANINVDMVGRNAPDSIVVIGQEYSSMGRILETVAARHAPELGLTVADDLWPEQRFFFRSDHFNFARREIPALFFFAGTHEDYHRPGDEVDTVDTDKIARVGRLVFYLTHDLAQAQDAPAWNPEGLETIRRLTQ